MYITPILFPQFTNREDFLAICSIYDDDTNQPVNLSGTNLATPGASFTASAWTVTDGAIVTTSSTSITIPTPPIGNQLSALAMPVGTGLAIRAGDPITIADTATGLNTLSGYVTSYTSATGALVCQIGWTFQFEIRDASPVNLSNDYSTAYTIGTTIGQSIITASLANYISIIDIGYFQIMIPESVFKTLLDAQYNSQANSGSRTYLASMTMTDSVNTRQLFTGRLPVLYGGVTN